MIKILLVAGALAVAIPLVAAAYRPDTFRVQRSASIKAPAARLRSFINDMHAFNTWNPYSRKDPNMRGEYEGPASGPGAVFRFAGNKDVGRGSLSIVDAQPSRITMKLDMVEPFEGHNTVEFILAPQGDTTEVTWSMRGRSPYLARLVGLFLDMDSMVGRDFEAGLSNLKARAEQAA